MLLIACSLRRPTSFQYVSVSQISTLRRDAMYAVTSTSCCRHRKPQQRRCRGDLLSPLNKNCVPHFSPIFRSCFHPGISSLSREDAKLLSDGEVISGRKVLKEMLSYIWPKDDEAIKKRVKISLALLLGAKLLNVSVPLLFKHIVDHLNAITASVPEMTPALNLATAPNTALTVTLSLILAYGIARAGSTGFNEFRNAVFARVAQNSIRRIAGNVFLHLHNMDLRFHLSRQTGALSKTIDRGSRGINFVLSAMVFNVIPTILELALVSALLGWKCGGPYATIAVSCVSVYFVFTLAVTQWRTKFRLRMNKAENEASNKAIDSLINYETVKYFNNEKYEAARYDEALRKYEESALKTSTSLAALNFGQNAIFTSAISLAMMMAAQDVVNGSMTVGDLVMINGLLFQLYIPLGFLGSVYREVRQALIDMQNMFTLMTKQPSIKSATDARPITIKRDNSDIEFRHVHFQYLPGQPILRDLSFAVKGGKKTAIVGGSGSGKSTIVRLLYRFYEPNGGEILIGGNNIKEMSLENLRKSIAVVPQDCVLFHDTIYHNLHYGNLNKGESEVYQAANIANLHAFITNWPNGYQTQVGERGLKLSGGEKQRVAIARAILKESPILIFDEATSSLDSITEQNILETLKKATEGKTSICIAHRLSTVRDADEILVLDRGALSERGTHDDLLNRQDGLYRRLWEMQ